MNVNKQKNYFFDYAMLIINTIIMLSVILLVSGCSQKEVIVQHQEVKKTELNLVAPSAIKLNDISYIVITDKNSKDVFEKMNKDKVLYALDAEDYQNLSINLEYIKKYIIEQQQIIKAYQDYYEPIKTETKPQKIEIQLK